MQGRQKIVETIIQDILNNVHEIPQIADNTSNHSQYEDEILGKLRESEYLSEEFERVPLPSFFTKTLRRDERFLEEFMEYVWKQLKEQEELMKIILLEEEKMRKEMLCIENFLPTKEGNVLHGIIDPQESMELSQEMERNPVIELAEHEKKMMQGDPIVFARMKLLVNSKVQKIEKAIIKNVHEMGK